MKIRFSLKSAGPFVDSTFDLLPRHTTKAGPAVDCFLGALFMVVVSDRRYRQHAICWPWVQQAICWSWVQHAIVGLLGLAMEPPNASAVAATRVRAIAVIFFIVRLLETDSPLRIRISRAHWA